VVSKVVKCFAKSQVRSDVLHMRIMGWSGKGKDVFGEQYITQKVGKFKVIDFHSVERNEGFFYSIPNTNPSMLRRLQFFANGRLKPKSFKNDIVMICGRKILKQDRLPKNVSIRSLDKDLFVDNDMIPFLTNTHAGEGLLQMIFFFNEVRGEKPMNIDDLQNYLLKIINDQLPDMETTAFKSSKGNVVPPILRNIISLKSSGIFSEKFPKISLDELLKDSQSITTISYSLLDTSLERAVAQSLLLNMVVKQRDEIKKKAKLIPLLIYYREFQVAYNKHDESFYRNCSMLRQKFWWILTEGRDNKITLIANYQTPKQIPDNVANQFQKHFSLAVPKKEAESFQSFAPIPPLTINKLSLCGRGQGLFFASGTYKYPVEVMPTLHMKKEAGFNVMEHLQKVFGSYDIEKEYGVVLDDQLFRSVDGIFTLSSTSPNGTQKKSEKRNDKEESDDGW